MLSSLRTGQFCGEICWCGSMAEQLICNQQVGGSTPFTSSTFLKFHNLYGGIPEWPKGADCKSVVSDFGGSNPPSPTRQLEPNALRVLLFYLCKPHALKAGSKSLRQCMTRRIFWFAAFFIPMLTSEKELNRLPLLPEKIRDILCFFDLDF